LFLGSFILLIIRSGIVKVEMSQIVSRSVENI